MKTKLTLITIGLACVWNLAQATEFGNVVSSTPVMAKFAVPREQCYDQQETHRPPTTGGGAVVGAVLGGVLGHNVGAGTGRAVATGVGVVAGAAVGNQIEASNTTPVTTTVRTCQDSTIYDDRVVGYDVVYDFEGRRYQTRMDHDPGSRIALDVSTTLQAAPLVVYEPNVVYSPAPVYYNPYYYYGPAYAGPTVVVSETYHHGGYYHH